MHIYRRQTALVNAFTSTHPILEEYGCNHERQQTAYTKPNLQPPFCMCPYVFPMPPLHECHHLLCQECLEHVRTEKACPACGCRVLISEVSTPTMLTNIVHAFKEFETGLLKATAEGDGVADVKSPDTNESTNAVEIDMHSPLSAQRRKIIAKSVRAEHMESSFFAECSMDPNAQYSLLSSLPVPAQTLSLMTQDSECHEARDEIVESRQLLNDLLRVAPRSLSSLSQSSPALPPLASSSESKKIAVDGTELCSSPANDSKTASPSPRPVPMTPSTMISITLPAVDTTPGYFLRTPEKPPLESLEPLAVVATYSSISNLLLFEDARTKGWIATTQQPILDGHVKILITETTTTSDGRRMAARTVMYMKCLLLSFVIVDFAWLKESLLRNALQPTDNYLVSGSVFDRNDCKASGVDVSGRRNLFRGLTFSLVDGISFSKFKQRDVVVLIQLAGGELALDSNPNKSVRGNHVTLSMSLKKRQSRCLCTANDVKDGKALVSVSWLFDCICSLTVLPFDTEYLLGVTTG